METRVVLGMDIGGTNMRFGLVDAHYHLKSFESLQTQLVMDCEDPYGQFIDCIKQYLGKYNQNRLPDAISMGFPSTIDKERRVVVSTPNIKSIPDNFEIAKALEDAFEIPVYVNRDVNYLLLYDSTQRAYDKDSIVLGIYYGTGIGNAIQINGRLLLGKNGVAAELGHTPVLDNTKPCGCGNQGCIETIASGGALFKMQQMLFPDTPINQMFKLHKEKAELVDFVDKMAIPAATEINIFDPDYVIIGGGIVQMDGFPHDLLEERIRTHTRKPYPEANLDIAYSLPDQKNGVIGAGIYAMKRFEDPEYK